MIIHKKPTEGQKQPAVGHPPCPTNKCQPALLIPPHYAPFKGKARAHVRDQQASPPLTKIASHPHTAESSPRRGGASHVSAFRKPIVQIHLDQQVPREGSS